MRKYVFTGYPYCLMIVTIIIKSYVYGRDECLSNYANPPTVKFNVLISTVS